jgi:hypothetical protein
MCAITIAASELGNFLNPSDREMVDLLVSLWDGQKGTFKKLTKTQGQDDIINPWVNMIACTTPAWLAGNFPEYMIGGGFASRCIFVYAEEKRQFVAYPRKSMPLDHVDIKRKLIEDLIMISNIRGEYILTPEAERWGTLWYENHHKNRPKLLDNDRFGGYIARKQTHIHKVAMILAASVRQETVIEVDDLVEANILVSGLEQHMPKVFDKIGVSPEAKGQAELVSVVRAHGVITNNDLYKQLFRILSYEDFLKCLQSAMAAGMTVQANLNGQLAARAVYDTPTPKSNSDGVTELGDRTPHTGTSG